MKNKRLAYLLTLVAAPLVTSCQDEIVQKRIMVFENYTAREANPIWGNNFPQFVNVVAPGTQGAAAQACRQSYIHTQRFIDEQIRSGTKIVSQKPFSETTSAKTPMINQLTRDLWSNMPHRGQYFDKDWNMKLVVNCTGTEYLLEGKKSSLYPKGEE